ncbi:MAG: hypothetical protein Q6373_015415 [Candidatus Sigynarchaeota archaeon]
MGEVDPANVNMDDYQPQFSKKMNELIDGISDKEKLRDLLVQTFF